MDELLSTGTCRWHYTYTPLEPHVLGSEAQFKILLKANFWWIPVNLVLVNFISSLITEIFQPGFCLRELESVLVNNLHAFLTGEKD